MNGERSGFMIELEQAIALVTGALSPQIDSELVPLAQASGRDRKSVV